MKDYEPIKKIAPIQKELVKNARGDVVGHTIVNMEGTIEGLVECINAMVDGVNTLTETLSMVIDYLDVERKEEEESK